MIELWSDSVAQREGVRQIAKFWEVIWFCSHFDDILAKNLIALRSSALCVGDVIEFILFIKLGDAIDTSPCVDEINTFSC